MSRTDSKAFLPQATLQSTPWLLRRLARQLDSAGVSAITLVTPTGETLSVGQHNHAQPEPILHIHKASTLLRGWRNGMMGWGEGYMANEWSASDLITLTDWAMHNEDKLKQLFKTGSLSHLINRIWHSLHANTRRGSQRNIAFHYDLGNDFYQHWLDPSMTYSSALFSDPQQSLSAAQAHKYQRIFDLSEAGSNSQILEVGCGWGGFAEHVARQAPDASLTGVTLSKEQLAYAKQRIQTVDANARIDLRYQDYRDITGEFDQIVSIEMFEAVGQENWPTYFNMLSERLKQGGSAVLQIICIDESRFDYYQRHTDFIQRYIFPGGMLPTRTHVKDYAQRQGLVLEETVRFGQDYATTLRLWRQAFLQQWPQIAALGYPEQFRRMWEFYLAYCESGFRHDALDVCLFKLRKPTTP